MMTVCSVARVEALACSEAGAVAVACSWVGIEDDRRWQHDSF
jgi:hypothetical protein